MEALLHVIKQQPKLTKEASSALIDIGEAVHATATPEEMNVLVQGTLNQEVYARNSCLQAIQVISLSFCFLRHNELMESAI